MATDIEMFTRLLQDNRRKAERQKIQLETTLATIRSIENLLKTPTKN